jgi:uncharacterized membrane protein YhaH (DUF805 family)
VFDGTVLPGFDRDDVRRALAALLRLDEARSATLFSGRRAVLKRDVSVTEAVRYVAHLAKLGAEVHMEPMPALELEAPTEWPTLTPPDEEYRQPAPAAPAPPPIAAKATLELQPIEGEGEQVTCPNCGLTQGKRVLCRQCATDIPMALAARREEADLRRMERQIAFEARAARRRGEVDRGVRSASPIGFSFEGRIARLPSLVANLWLLTALALLTVGLLQRPSFERVALLMLGVFAVFFFSMRLTVLRCHDCGRHGWWALFVLVPYVGNLAGLLFAMLPGDDGSNDYGPPPRKGHWLWFFVAVLALLAASAALVKAGIRFAEREASQRQAQAASEDEADEVIEFGDDANADINEAFRNGYLRAAGHKAFAASSTKAFGWAGHASSVPDAVSEALSRCEARRQPYTPACRVVSIDGQGVHAR